MYVPESGEICWLDFDSQAGSEIMKRRPALVFSPKVFNERVGFAWVCPITTPAPRHGFQMSLPSSLRTLGTVKIEQMRSLDFKARNAEFIERVPLPFLVSCQQIAGRILGL